jgi:hypothetical protein
MVVDWLQTGVRRKGRATSLGRHDSGARVTRPPKGQLSQTIGGNEKPKNKLFLGFGGGGGRRAHTMKRGRGFGGRSWRAEEGATVHSAVRPPFGRRRRQRRAHKGAAPAPHSSLFTSFFQTPQRHTPLSLTQSTPSPHHHRRRRDRSNTHKARHGALKPPFLARVSTNDLQTQTRGRGWRRAQGPSGTRSTLCCRPTTRCSRGSFASAPGRPQHRPGTGCSLAWPCAPCCSC